MRVFIKEFIVCAAMLQLCAMPAAFAAANGNGQPSIKEKLPDGSKGVAGAIAGKSGDLKKTLNIGNNPGGSSKGAGTPTEAEKLLEGGISYFTRGDYSSCLKLLKNITSSTPNEFGMASYYIGSVEAYSGNVKLAYDSFVEAIKFAPEQYRYMAALQFAKLADANGNYDVVRARLFPLEGRFPKTGLLSYYLMKARLADKSDKSARADFYKILEKEFAIPDSLFADCFVWDKISKDKLMSYFPLPENSAAGQENAANARRNMVLFPSKKLGKEFSKAGFLAETKISEDGDIENAGAFEADLLKNKDAPFAWKAALALARNSFNRKDYPKTLEYAKAAEFFAPPDLRVSWPAVMLCGDAYRMEKKFPEALECYLRVAMDRTLRGEPLAESLYKCGVCWYDQSDWARAHPYFERVYILYFKFEYWGSRAYYYDATALLQMGERRSAAATLLEYFKRAKDKDSQIYKIARALYRQQWGGR